MTVPHVVLGRTGINASLVGLGCSRLGSILADCSGKKAEALLQHAIDMGVRLFDTADIYGQGESERLLGSVLAESQQRDRVIVVTKAGQTFTATQRFAATAKVPLRLAAARFPRLRSAIAAQRATPLPRDYRPAHLTRALEGSLRRLRTDYVDVFLLHSPTAADLNGDTGAMAVREIETHIARGSVRTWGVSCDDVASLDAALGFASLGVLQLPRSLLPHVAPQLEQIGVRGIGLLIREIFSSINQGLPNLPQVRQAALEDALRFPNSAALIGTTRVTHVDDLIGILKSIIPASVPAVNSRSPASTTCRPATMSAFRTATHTDRSHF